MLTIIILFNAVTAITWPVYPAVNVYFRLYNQSNPETFQIFTSDNITNCDVNVSHPFKFMFHGYLNGPTTKWLTDAKDEYFNKGSYNIIIVDWSSMSYSTYLIAANSIKKIGNITGEFIHKLHTEKLIPYDQIHLIGHSMGAHASGLAGKYIKSISGESIARITGLDPAYKPFSKYPSTRKLFQTDADFVDVIHTDDFGFGNPQTELGLANFFPNGGIRLQPGCYSKRRKRQIDVPIPDLACSHGRSFELFVESINADRFVAKKCDHYYDYIRKRCFYNPVAIMGENVDLNTVGSYYLETNSDSPYAKGP